MKTARPARRQPRCLVIARPNGAGKTTFARQFLPREAGIIHFVNADLIVAGLSPLWPEVPEHSRLKEAVFAPFLNEHGDARAPGAGRETLMRETLKRFDALLTRCPELKDLLMRLKALSP